jgi:hypothetical protein
MMTMRRILRTMTVAVVCGSVALLGACTSGNTESGSSPSAGSPSAPSRAAEDLLGMLLTPEDLDGQWVVNEAAPPHVITDEERAESEWAGPADSAVCADAPSGAADRIALIAPWTVSVDFTWPAPTPETDLMLGWFESLVSGDPETLSAAVAVAQACPPDFSNEQGFAQTPPVQQPVQAGDEAVVWRTGGASEGSSYVWREWSAWVRAGDVLMLVAAAERAEENADPVLTDEAFVTSVATAADKLG